MAAFKVDKTSFGSLQDKVVVVSGSATGIGAATVRLLCEAGAKVVLGDINEAAATALVKELNVSKPDRAFFVPCDVTDYDEIYNLFKTAHDHHGRVDHAVSCAGILERGNWFDPALTIDSVANTRASRAVIDVNVMGSAEFSRIAVVFLRDGMASDSKGTKSLTLLSSVNAFRDSPGLYMYQTSKHAVQGLMRSMRKLVFERDGIRVNCVCPGVTDTPMTAGIVEKFKDAGLYWQTANSVGLIVLGIICAAGMNGKAVYVEGGEGWEFEDSLYQTQPEWLGEEPTRRMRVNTEAVNKGVLIKDD